MLTNSLVRGKIVLGGLNLLQRIYARIALPIVQVTCSQDKKRYLASLSLDSIYLLDYPKRCFSFSGPSDSALHYCIPGFLRSDSVSKQAIMIMIKQERYFILHSQPRSGKTSFLIDLRDELNSTGEYAALYLDMSETSKCRVETTLEKIKCIIDLIDVQCRETFRANFKVAELVAEFVPAVALFSALCYLSKEMRRRGLKFVVLMDQIHSVGDDVVLSIFRQLRTGHDQRPHTFPECVVLSDSRDPITYHNYSPKTKNISALEGSVFTSFQHSINLPHFSRNHVLALTKQHEKNTGQVFDAAAVDKIMEWTNGHPWCVNRVFYECVEMHVTDRKTLVTADAIDVVVRRLVLRRETHISNLSTVLRDDRIRSVFDKLLARRYCNDEDSLQHAYYLGILTETNNNPQNLREITNKMYAEIIPRELVANEPKLTDSLLPIQISDFIDEEHRIDIDFLIREFQAFFEKHGDLCLSGYKESSPRLLFKAFCAQVVNRGGFVYLGEKNIDIFIDWPRIKLHQQQQQKQQQQQQQEPKQQEQQQQEQHQHQHQHQVNQREIIKFELYEANDELKSKIATCVEEVVEFLSKMDGVDEAYVAFFQNWDAMRGVDGELRCRKEVQCKIVAGEE